MYKITKTEDFAPLARLYHDSGLEVNPSSGTPEGILQLWHCLGEDGTLLGGITLQMRKGHYVLAHLAVIPQERGKGLGEQLISIAEEDVRSRGADLVWLVGKIPGYYRRLGWSDVPPEEAPPISRCLTCQQFGDTCFPSVMQKSL